MDRELIKQLAEYNIFYEERSFRIRIPEGFAGFHYVLVNCIDEIHFFVPKKDITVEIVLKEALEAAYKNGVSYGIEQGKESIRISIKDILNIADNE